MIVLQTKDGRSKKLYSSVEEAKKDLATGLYDVDVDKTGALKNISTEKVKEVKKEAKKEVKKETKKK